MNLIINEQETMDEIIEAFKVFDRDENGTLSGTDLLHVLNIISPSNKAEKLSN